MNKLINLYNNNAYFHGFVTAIEYAIVSFIVGYTGGVPTNRQEWTALAMALGGAVFGGIKGWLSSNVIQKNLAAASAR